jgi:hypothetical protein
MMSDHTDLLNTAVSSDVVVEKTEPVVVEITPEPVVVPVVVQPNPNLFPPLPTRERKN